MVVSTLARLSEDKLTRQEYLRRQDDIMLNNKRTRDYELMKQRTEQMKQKTEQMEAEIERLRKENAELRAGKTT